MTYKRNAFKPKAIQKTCTSFKKFNQLFAQSVKKRIEVSFSSMLYQEFLEKFIIIKICRQNIFKKYKEKEGIVFCPLSYCLFNLTFLLLKCYRSLMRLCCQYFSSSKLFHQILFFFMHSLQTEEIKLYEAAYFFVDLCTYNRKSL